MAGIVGTITSINDFLSKTQVCLSVKPNQSQVQSICLDEDRQYSIPAFQREVRWDDNNLKMLLFDLSRGNKFLGNIILTVKSDHTCEIIDGQQRTTVLMLIVTCIKKKFGKQISTPELCPLRNEGFTGFQQLLDKDFDLQAITQEEWETIHKSDDYNQFPRIQRLWDTIASSELLSDRHKAQGLLDNLCKSEFNIIASYSDDVNTSIQYFLDVNLKGIRLDTEDIFKGYLFSQDAREQTRSLWQKNKRDVLRLNGVKQSSEEKRYPLMKLYEHFFYCDLYLSRDDVCEYSSLRFGENFCLTSEFESGSTKFYEGSHLIEAIRDRNYLQNVLSRLNECVLIMTDIIESEAPSSTFKSKFICEEKVDSIDIQNFHSMLKKILMEKEVIPKILALKYILTYFDGQTHKKAEYKSAYSVFCAAVLFTVFANKKESDTFYNFVRLEDWKSRIDKWLYDYITSHSNLNVLPYKNKTFDTSELKKTINKNGSEYVIAQIGLHAYEILQEKMSAGEQEIVLPVEVKQQLSAGEKQIFIMALYQALSQLNKIDVPYIVDTPFARIDKEHRGKILEQFFKQLNGQVIILSTDEEIVGDYCNVISDIVSNTFVLNHTINGNTEILSDTYFGGSI